MEGGEAEVGGRGDCGACGGEVGAEAGGEGGGEGGEGGWVEGDAADGVGGGGHCEGEGGVLCMRI